MWDKATQGRFNESENSFSINLLLLMHFPSNSIGKKTVDNKAGITTTRSDNVFYFDFIIEKSAILTENVMNNLANVKHIYQNCNC